MLIYNSSKVGNTLQHTIGMYDTPDCLHIKLTEYDLLQVMTDYVVALGVLGILYFLYKMNELNKTITFSFVYGFLLGAPFEFIQPRIGWVSYYKCATYLLAPENIMWIVHSIWDSAILNIIMIITHIFFGKKIWKQYSCKAMIFMGMLGVSQDIVLECYQTLWYYQPNPINPTWTHLCGKDMTLQQWHWALLPVFFYVSIFSLPKLD